MKQLTSLIQVWAGVATLLRKSSSWLAIAVIGMALLEAAAGIGMLYAFKVVVDAVAAITAVGSMGGASSVVPPLLWAGIATAATVALHSLGNLLRLWQGMRVAEVVDQEIHRRTVNVDLGQFETPKFLDMLERARRGGSKRPAQIISTTTIAFRGAATLIGTLALIAAADLWLIPLLLGPMIVALVLRLQFTRVAFRWRAGRAQRDRRATYLDFVLTSGGFAKELRIYDQGQHFSDQYRSIRSELKQIELKIETRKFLGDLALALIAAAVFVGAALWLVDQALAGSKTLGDVVLVVMLLRTAQTSGSELVASTSRIADDHLYLQDLMKFLDTRPRIAAPAAPAAMPTHVTKGLKLSNVTFRYEGADANALSGVSLELPVGKIVALVGENGSGKTTLIKILTRLLEPANGQVTLDGLDVRSFSPAQYRRLFGVVFQDYVYYADTVSNNIRLGDINSEPDHARIRAAAEDAGALSFLDKLPRGLDTALTRLFDDGLELSIGQWQRLALSRAFYPRTRFLVLDEPTSSVDPKSEFEFFDGFRERLRGRGALVISHRLSTVRLADYTYVLREGEIVEQGSHESLIALGGVYATLFARQASYFS